MTTDKKNRSTETLGRSACERQNNKKFARLTSDDRRAKKTIEETISRATTTTIERKLENDHGGKDGRRRRQRHHKRVKSDRNDRTYLGSSIGGASDGGSSPDEAAIVDFDRSVEKTRVVLLNRSLSAKSERSGGVEKSLFFRCLERFGFDATYNSTCLVLVTPSCHQNRRKLRPLGGVFASVASVGAFSEVLRVR